MIDPEFIELAIKSAAKGKTRRKAVREILDNPEPTINKIITQLETHTWMPPNHETTSLREGAHRKQRDIQKPLFDNEQIIHHMLIRRLRPIIEPKFYEWSCGSVPGRGPLLVMRTMRKWIRKYGDQTIYAAELDIRKFYQNVDVEILKQQIQHFIKDNKFLEILFKVIDGAAPGLPLGFYTSPWLGNLYLTPLDMHIKHILRPDHYVRYMDNLFLISTNKEQLHKIVSGIRAYCVEQLHVEIKPDWQVFQFEKKDEKNIITGRPINCLGFVIHCDRVTLRKSLLKRIRAKGARMHKNGRVKLLDAAAMISYSGWLRHTDVYDYYCQRIKPNISFPYCKKMISKKTRNGVMKNDRLERSSQQ